MKQLISVFLASLTALSVPAEAADCRTQREVADAQALIEAELKVIEAEPGKLRASLESQLSARATTLGWSKERLSEVRTLAFSSVAYWSLEKEKQPYISALADAVTSSSGPDSRISKCEAAKKVKSLTKNLAKLNLRQYEHAAREINLAKDLAK